ncbi:MAG: DUF748 domain-containing protein [Mariprofundaceae bacterium]|nr:DUF748 domain-containing protein [Mariprofundaceae bacterium]
MPESEARTTGIFQRHQRLFTALAILTATVLLLLSLLPSAIRIGATSWLEHHGIQQVEIENVDINLFRGSFAIEGFSADTGLKAGRLAVDIDWWPMLSRRIFVRSLELKDIEAGIHQREDGAWQLAGIVPDRAAAEVEKTAEPGKPWQVVLNSVGFSDLKLKASGNIDSEPFDLSLPLHSLVLSLVKPEESGAQLLKSSIRLGKVAFNSSGYSVESSALQLDGMLSLPAMGSDVAAGLKLDDLNLKMTDLLLLEGGVRLAAVDSVELDRLSVAGSSRALFDRLSLQKLKADGFTLHDTRQNIVLTAVDSIDLDQLSVAGSRAAFERLSLQGAALQPSDNEPLGRVRALSLYGAELDISGPDGLNRIITGDLSVSLKRVKADGFTLHDTRQNIVLTTVDSIDLDQLSVAGSRALFDRLSLQQITLPASGDDSLGRVGKVNLYGGNLGFSGICRVKTIAVHDLHAFLKKQKNGRIFVLDRLHTGSETGATPQIEAEPGGAETVNSSKAQQASEPGIPSAADKCALFIEEFLLSKGSTVTFRDESVFPAADIDLMVERLGFVRIDSPGKESGKLDALLMLGKNGSLTIEGEMSPNVSDFRADLKVALKNFDITELSGYIEPDFGHSVQTGQLDLQSGIRISDSRIEASNSLMLRKLALKKSQTPGKAAQSLGMPVNTALDLLRDSRGDISIDVPVTGRLDSPDVNLDDVVRKALASAIRTGALSYAKHLLQPYGLIFTATELAAGLAKSAARPRLTPIEFSERSSALRPGMAAYTEKIAALMQSRNFRLQICGIATRIEGGGVTVERPLIMDDEQLRRLARARSDRVLKAIRDHGVAAERLFGCSPGIDEKGEKALPRVELILD